MKKIIPFNNILDFNTDVCEITSISLEHKFNEVSDLISGEFYISGEYKISDGLLEKEKFNFTLPFDIALGNDYKVDTLVIDIDDFRYELIERNKLKVNIDLYLDGEIISLDRADVSEKLVLDTSIEEVEENEKEIEEVENVEEVEEVILPEEVDLLTSERLDLFDEMQDKKEDNVTVKEENINENNNNNNNNIFNSIKMEDNYVTYRVHRVCENDTIEKILTDYKITKDELEKYNQTLEIKVNDKLIIPTHNEK